MTTPKTNAPKCTVTARRCVWVRVLGAERPQTGRYPMTRDDGGLLQRLRQHEDEVGIQSLFTMMSGGGMLSCLYSESAAAEIVRWLRASGIRVEE